MTWRVLLTVMCGGGLMVTTTAGCGTSGSEPVLFPEVRFEVSPVAGAQPPFQFVVERFVIGGVLHTDLSGTTFTSTDVFRFVFENAPPPYTGTFRQVGGAAIRVHLLQEGTGIETTQMTSGNQIQCGSPTSSDPACIVNPSIFGPQPTRITLPNPEVRFDVCAPLVASVSCLMTRVCSNNPVQPCATDADCPGGTCSPDPGRFNVQFNGVIGDPFVTYLLGIGSSTVNAPAFTPAIYYFEGASQTVNAVFTPFIGTLAVQFFINGQLSQNGTGGGSIVFEQDL
jgi:hypothetical protein